MSDLKPEKSSRNIEAQLEALLFVAPGTVTPAQLAEALHLPGAMVEEALSQYEKTLIDRGLRLQWHNGRVQMTTPSEMAPIIEKFLGLDATSRLSRAGLETLAIVAYRQPITRPGIDAIRGVNSDGVLKSLLNKGLVEEVGRSDGPGRPILYGTTSEFLQHFGLTSLNVLPPFEEKIEVENTSDKNLLKD